MTTQEFIDTLSQAHSQFNWALTPDTGFHAQERKRPRLLLRAVLTEGPDSHTTFEPMGALHYIRTGQIFTPRDWSPAGDALQLQSARAADLNSAAIDNTWAGQEGRREPVVYLQTLRTRLIDAVGLSVATMVPMVPRDQF